MPLVKAQCTNCFGVIQVDNTKEAAICDSCGTPFIVEKAINNYITHNDYNIQNAHFTVLNENSAKMKLKNAEVFLTKHHDYDKAFQLYKEASELIPDDYQPWLGLARILTSDFTRYPALKYSVDESPKYFISSINEIIANKYPCVLYGNGNKFVEATKYIDYAKKVAGDNIKDITAVCGSWTDNYNSLQLAHKKMCAVVSVLLKKYIELTALISKSNNILASLEADLNKIKSMTKPKSLFNTVYGSSVKDFFVSFWNGGSRSYFGARTIVILASPILIIDGLYRILYVNEKFNNAKNARIEKNLKAQQEANEHITSFKQQATEQKKLIIKNIYEFQALNNSK